MATIKKYFHALIKCFIIKMKNIALLAICPDGFLLSDLFLLNNFKVFVLKFVEIGALGDESFEGNLNLFLLLSEFCCLLWKFFFGWKIDKVKDG